MYVIGTAGHVDHGKSALVHALTGIDPDRLAEERERGLTIDLGFAWLTLPSGHEVSIVDVPGHERFIKNMLAGAGGVDLALLVVAADEGPRLQTHEHLSILERLDVPAALAVVTKADLVEPEFVDLVRLEVEELLAGSRLTGAPVLAVSAVTGAGLDELRLAIDAALAAVPRKRDLQRPRLPVDRAFSMPGFGTVVTGTLLDGSLFTGMQVEVQPGGRKARIRGLQRHRQAVDSLEPGTRAAVNLSGVQTADLRRGMVVTLPGVMRPVFVVDARLTFAASARHSLLHDSVVTFLSGTAESEARVRLLDTESLGPGESAWAQVVLADEVAVLPGDRCILRTPNETVAGGPIVDINPRRHRRFHEPTLATLAAQLTGTPETRLAGLLATGPLEVSSISRLLGTDEQGSSKAAAALISSGSAEWAGPRLYGRDWLGGLTAALEGSASAYLDQHSLKSRAPREHLRSQLKLAPEDFEAVVSHGVATGIVEVDFAGDIGLPGRVVTLSEQARAQVERFVAALEREPYSPPTTDLPAAELLDYMEGAGLIVQTRAGVIFAAGAFAEMQERALAVAAASGQVTLAEVRDLFGTSRKYAQAFLEHLDDLKLTRRVGDARVLRER